MIVDANKSANNKERGRRILSTSQNGLIGTELISFLSKQRGHMSLVLELIDRLGNLEDEDEEFGLLFAVCEFLFLFSHFDGLLEW